MKKLVLTSACVLAATGAALAQGTVSWLSISPAAFTAQIDPVVESTFVNGIAPGGTVASVPTTGSYFYELLYNTTANASAPTTLSALSSWTDAGIGAVNSATSAGKVSTVSPSADATVPFTTAESIIFVGWSASLGSTISAVEATLASPSAISAADSVTQAYFGVSKAGYIAPNAAGVSPGATFFGPATGEIDSVNTQLYAVNSVPEPTTIALGVMGAASLLALRRKKA
jgi:hypothetical protein